MELWIMILAGLGILFLVVFKYQNFQGNISNFIVAFFIFFLVITATYFYFVNKPDLTDFDNLVKSIGLYFSWLFTIGDNTKEIAGYAIKQNWTLLNNSFVSK